MLHVEKTAPSPIAARTSSGQARQNSNQTISKAAEDGHDLTLTWQCPFTRLQDPDKPLPPPPSEANRSAMRCQENPENACAAQKNSAGPVARVHKNGNLVSAERDLSIGADGDITSETVPIALKSALPPVRSNHRR